jgi:hypothetical protein
MKCPLGVEQTATPGVRSGKFDGGFHTLAAGVGEMGFLQAPSGASTETGGKLSRQFGHVALEHHRPAPAQLFDQCFDNARVVVTRIVNTITGEEIQHSSAICTEEFGALAKNKCRIHLQNIEQPHPLRVYRFGVQLITGNQSWH